MNRKRAIVVGAGIVGLATARALAIKGFAVKVFERDSRAVGASIRNFGMIWPIGQPEGKLYDRAIRSRNIWKEICAEAGIWHEQPGSLHLAYHPDEFQVLIELQDVFLRQGRNVSILDKEAILKKYSTVNPLNLLGGLYSAEEMIVDPREAIQKLPAYLAEKYPVEFFWGNCISRIDNQVAYIGETEQHEADIIFVCSGADFETLYPAVFEKMPITKCKLQMMRLAAQPDGERIDIALCGGLSLVHYKSFKEAPSLNKLLTRYDREMKQYMQRGIHVMVAQNQLGQLTVGDSHEYGPTHDPFNNEIINKMVLDYLHQFAVFTETSIIENWNGIYAKLTDGDAAVVTSPANGVYLINGLGGAGMTLSFGLAEEVVESLPVL